MKPDAATPRAPVAGLQIAATPDLLIALVFLALWLKPGYFGVSGYDYLCGVYRVEALAVIFMFAVFGGLQESQQEAKPNSMLERLLARGLPAGLLLVVAVPMIVAAATRQPLSMVVGYALFAANRTMLVFFWLDQPNERKRVVLTNSVISIMLFLGCFFAAAVLLPHVPDWGLDPATGLALETPSRFQLDSGPKPERPKLLAMFGVAYFCLQALLQSWVGFWNRVADGSSRLKLWRW